MRPASISGRSVAIGPCGQQPGLVTRLALAMSVRLARGHLGKAIDPAFGDAVRRRRVDHPRGVVLDQRDAFLGRIVGQAEDRDVGGVEEALALGEVLALVRDRSRSARCRAGRASRSRIWRPVVPASPSMKTVATIAASFVRPERGAVYRGCATLAAKALTSRKIRGDAHAHPAQPRQAAATMPRPSCCRAIRCARNGWRRLSSRAQGSSTTCATASATPAPGRASRSACRRPAWASPRSRSTCTS